MPPFAWSTATVQISLIELEADDDDWSIDELETEKTNDLGWRAKPLSSTEPLVPVHVGHPDRFAFEWVTMQPT